MRQNLKKVVKTVRGKRGSVRRTYWVHANEPPKKQGFLRRHAGKLLAGAAIAGLAIANRHKLAGAARGAGLALSAHKHSGSMASASEKARDAFRMAKVGYASNRGMDRVDGLMSRARVHAPMAQASAQRGLAKARGSAAALAGRVRAGANMENVRTKATAWRRGTGADLAHHLASTGGDAAVSHFGSRFGQVAGTGLGAMMGGPAGMAVGGFIGGQAGAFLGSRHAAPHIARGANWLADRMRR